MQQDFWSAYNQASQYIKNFFYKSELNSLITGIEEKYDLPLNIIGGIVGDFVLRLIDQKNLALEIKNQCRIDLDRASKIKDELVEKLFSLDPKIKAYISNPNKSFEQAMEEEQKEKEDLAPVDYEKTLAKVIPQLKAFVKQSDLGRLQTIVSSYYGSVRTLSQTKEKLMHGQKIGGLDLDEQTAELIINILRNTDAVRKTAHEKMEVNNADELKEKTRQIMNITQGDKAKLENMLQLYIEQKDTISLIAVFRILTATNQLFDVLSLHPMYSQVITEKLSKQELEEFSLKKTHPKYMQLFLKSVFMEYLGLPMQQAGKYISQLSIMLDKMGKKEYADMAYYDLSTQSFKFTKYQ